MDRPPPILVITALRHHPGAEPGEMGGTLNSDVDRADFQRRRRGRARAGHKESDPLGPSPANFITIDRYHMSGISEPTDTTSKASTCRTRFDSAMLRAGDGGPSRRHSASRSCGTGEGGSAAQRARGTILLILPTIAEVTFYGHDQTGRAVGVMGRIGISFADFADPDLTNHRESRPEAPICPGDLSNMKPLSISTRTLIGAVLAAALAIGQLHDEEPGGAHHSPGPSEFGTSVTITVSPDVLRRTARRSRS